MTLYALPNVGSAGLGNELFPWARAELFARRFDVPVVAPRWQSVRIGPYIRREPDKRRYGRFFVAPEHVRGLSRLALRAIARRMPEGEADDVYEQAKASPRPSVVAIAGLGDLFAPLVREHAYLRDKLWRMTRPHLRPQSHPFGERFVALHVRRGDLTRQGFTRGELSSVKQFTPLSWFVAMVRAVRRNPDLARLPVVAFSDGSADELAELLAVDGVRLHRGRDAITDLWLLARATTLFASGYSTFGMWASFLGGMPTIYAPGKLQQRVQGGRLRAVELELAADDDLPDHAFAYGSRALFHE